MIGVDMLNSEAERIGNLLNTEDMRNEEKWSNLPVTSRISIITATSLVGIGVVLVIISFAYPPVGEVEDTTLYFFGMALTFFGALFGMNLHFSSVIDGKIQDLRKKEAKKVKK